MDGIGDTYREIMWRGLGLPGELAPSLGGGTNYAFGGSRRRYGSADMVGAVGARIPPALADMPTRDAASLGSFWGQLNLYLPVPGSVADPFALFLAMVGANDVRDVATLDAIGSTEATGLFQQSVGDVVDGVIRLVDAGARNIAFANVGDLGVTPEAQAFDQVQPGTADALSGLTASYNTAVWTTLNGAIGSLTGVDGLDLWYLDTFSRIGEIVADPELFGIINATDPCLTGYFVDTPTGGPIDLCTDPEDRAFYDRVHPTSALHAVFARDFLAAVPTPATWWLLLGSLPFVALARRLTSQPPERSATAALCIPHRAGTDQRTRGFIRPEMVVEREDCREAKVLRDDPAGAVSEAPALVR